MTEPVVYRGYFFVNALYMKEIQWGLQAGHTIASMFGTLVDAYKTSVKGTVSHQSLMNELNVLTDWANNHKTIIILNGGNHAELNSLFADIREHAEELELPHGIFDEDEQSLNNATTCVGVILPNSVYDLVLDPSGYAYCAEPMYGPLPKAWNPHKDTPQYKLKEIISRYHLAR